MSKGCRVCQTVWREVGKFGTNSFTRKVIVKFGTIKMDLWVFV